MEFKKQPYSVPFVEHIIIDNEISLALQSNPPFGPEEDPMLFSTGKMVNDPFVENGYL